MDAVWPVRVHPLEDELLSSYLSRVALSHGMSLDDLILYMKELKRFPVGLDIDRAPNQSFIKYLSDKTGSGQNVIESMTLKKYEGIVFESLPRLGWGNLLLPAPSNSKRKIKTGLPFCPECFKTDKIPYFRLYWRLAFYSICLRHQVILHDHCTECNEPVIGSFYGYSGWRYENTAMRCIHCGFDLSRTECLPYFSSFSSKNLPLEALLQDFSKGYLTTLDTGPHQYSIHFFEGWRQILSLLMRPRMRQKITQAMKSEGMDFDESLGNQFRPAFENLPLRCRHEAVCIALALTQEWPGKFTRICLTARLTESIVLIDQTELPYWFYSAIRESLCRFRYRANREEIAQIRDYLQRSNPQFTKNTVKKTIGITEGEAVDETIPVARIVYTVEETKKFFEEFDRQIKYASPSRGHRFCLARDRTIVLMTAFGLGTLSEICRWTFEDVEHAVELCRLRAHDSAHVPKLFENGACSNSVEHLVWYLGFVIDDWSRAEDDQPRFVFPSRQKIPIHIESIRIRAGVIKKNAGLTDVTSCIEALSLYRMTN
ncbi:TniQ family protein [Undibacterium sp. Di27W]|uniref:TniQ family protein n=1 Tax=Undibacterium sp. Di27W TaxID=3413036 RepID=UPI003BF0C8CF